MSEEIYEVKQPEPEEKNINLSVETDNSWADEARMREAELNHDLATKQLDFERERYYNAIPKSDKELELEYAYKNRLLDKRIADDQYRRSPAYKGEKYTVAGLILTGIGLIVHWIWDSFGGGRK